MAEVRKILATLVSSGKLSKEGLAWLILALDPWHDTQVKDCHGIPDENTGASVFCSIVQELQISAASLGIAANTIFDVRVATWPLLTRCPMDLSTRTGNIYLELAASPVNAALAPVTIEAVATGLDFPECPEPLSTNWLEVPPAFTKGPCKMAGMGVEVVNTTSLLNVQGLATCSRMTQPGREPFTAKIINAALTRSAQVSAVSARSVPKNLKEMTLIPGTTQWHAKEGAYSVVSLKNVTSQTAQVDPILITLNATDISTGPYNSALEGSNYITAMQAAAGLAADLVPASIPGRNCADSSIQMFTGLSPTTTLTIRARFLLERYPNDQESEILVLASPTANFDPVAIEIYSRVMSRLPPAVMFTMNPTGEFFRDMLKTLAGVAGPLLLALPSPYAKAAGLAITAGGEFLGDYNKQKKKAKKAKAKLPPLPSRDTPEYKIARKSVKAKARPTTFNVPR